MYKITVSGPERITEAIQWCSNHVESNWELDTLWPDPGCIFVFKDKKDASWFGLRWAQ
jgi:hypothetical protein